MSYFRSVIAGLPTYREAAVIDLHGRVGGRLVRLAVSRAEAMGGQLVWRPALPVTQLNARKTCGAASS